MTEYPAPPPPKGTNWKVIIPVAIIVILICLCLVIVGVLAYMGTQGKGPLAMLATATPTNTPRPTSTPTRTATNTPETAPVLGTWELYYDWDCDGDYNGPAIITFYDDYTFSIYEGTSDSAYGTWYTYGDTMDFIFDDEPYSNYIGTIYQDGYMEGSMDNTEGSSGCWYATQGAYGGAVPDSIEGDWDMYYDWSCDGGYAGPASITFYDDFSFYLSEEAGDLIGMWYTEGDYVEFLFDESPHAYYTGTIYAYDYMEGEMTTDDDQYGCWYAER